MHTAHSLPYNPYAKVSSAYSGRPFGYSILNFHPIRVVLSETTAFILGSRPVNPKAIGQLGN